MFQLRELQKDLQHKIKRFVQPQCYLYTVTFTSYTGFMELRVCRMGATESLTKVGWMNSLCKIESELEELELKLQPLRKGMLPRFHMFFTRYRNAATSLPQLALRAEILGFTRQDNMEQGFHSRPPPQLA